MGFEGASFLVVIDKDYGLRMLTAQGEPASTDDYFLVARTFDERWGEKSYIYFAEGKNGLYKVGVTNSITRRQKELGVRFVAYHRLPSEADIRPGSPVTSAVQVLAR